MSIQQAQKDISFAISRLTGGLGAEISCVDLAAGVSDAQFEALTAALYEYGIVVLHDQSLDNAGHIALARRFGELDLHPIVAGMADDPEIIKLHKLAGERASFGVGWHSDNSFMEKPSMGSIVRAEIVPPYGGDTLYANMRLAYETLSDGMRDMLDGLVAVHSAAKAYTTETALEKYDDDSAITYRRTDAISAEVEHPVVRTHPVTGARALYINPMFTLRLKDMTKKESAPLLVFLFAHATRPEFQCRLKWRPNSVAIWDNRLVVHNALDDYEAWERILYRVTIKGERPV